MTKTCLDLFCGLGGFSAAFVDSDNWDVVTVDIEEEFDPDIQADVMDLRPSDLPDADVVLASPPCKQFSIAASRYERMVDGEPQTPPAREAVTLVYHTIGLIKSLSPEYWFLENPVGHLRQIIGKPTATVTQCQYGEAYQKRTDLWGKHPKMDYRSCLPGEGCHSDEEHGFGSGEEHVRDPAERAKIPYELSEAILEAVEGRAEQKTLAVAGDADTRADSGGSS
jgi:hypothetical protein